jgi:hypothetical protein
MQREKIAVVGLVIIIVVALFAYFVATENIFGNLFDKKDDGDTDQEEYTIFDRYTTVQRNVTQNITELVPADGLEQQILFILRVLDTNFTYGSGSYADETVYFDIEVVKVYNCSGENHAVGDNDSNLTILWDDCADVHYISHYASNDTIFSTSYNDTVNKTGGTPLKVYVNKDTDVSNYVPENEEYSDYSNRFGIWVSVYYGDTSYLSTPVAIKEGFLEALIGMKAGEKITTDDIAPENAYGIKLQVGDILNFSSLELLGFSSGLPEMSIFDIQENATPIYILRDESHYIGEPVQSIDGVVYSSWTNSSEVTKINDTLIWVYTTPTTSVDELFTWLESNFTAYGETYTTYPTNKSYVSNLNDDAILVKHGPEVGDEIVINTFSYLDYSSTTETYIVEKITEDQIYTNLQEEE